MKYLKLIITKLIAFARYSVHGCHFEHLPV